MVHEKASGMYNRSFILALVYNERKVSGLFAA